MDLCSKNKGADQLHGYCAADLLLCFCKWKKQVFSCCGSSVFQVPIVLPAFLSLVSLAIVILTFYQKPHESFLVFGLVALGLVLYILGAKWKNKPKEIQDKIGELLSNTVKLVVSDHPFRRHVNCYRQAVAYC